MPNIIEKPQPYIPDTTQAEKWLTPFIFVYQGKTWEVGPYGEVAQIQYNARLTPAGKR